MSVNPYKTSDVEINATMRLGEERLRKELRAAERIVTKRSDALLAMDESSSTSRRRAAARARLTTACESRDRFLFALERLTGQVAS